MLSGKMPDDKPEMRALMEYIPSILPRREDRAFSEERRAYALRCYQKNAQVRAGRLIGIA